MDDPDSLIRLRKREGERVVTLFPFPLSVHQLPVVGRLGRLGRGAQPGRTQGQREQRHEERPLLSAVHESCPYLGRSGVFCGQAGSTESTREAAFVCLAATDQRCCLREELENPSSAWPTEGGEPRGWRIEGGQPRVVRRSRIAARPLMCPWLGHRTPQPRERARAPLARRSAGRRPHVGYPPSEIPLVISSLSLNLAGWDACSRCDRDEYEASHNRDVRWFQAGARQHGA
eukprot:scaffold80899_cov55-Phaeocystis_antarctica.AAC.2